MQLLLIVFVQQVVKDKINILKQVKESFLFDAISFISIVDVCLGEK